MNIKSRSAITFNELKDKVDEIHEFGNDWGLFIDIENDYQNQFGENSLNRKKYNPINNFEFDNDDIKYDKQSYFKRTKLFMTKLLFYLCIVFGVSYVFNDKKKI